MEVLFEATRDLQEEGAPARIRRAYADDPAGEGGFNLGILCCIPKDTAKKTSATAELTSLTRLGRFPLWMCPTA